VKIANNRFYIAVRRERVGRLKLISARASSSTSLFYQSLLQPVSPLHPLTLVTWFTCSFLSSRTCC